MLAGVAERVITPTYPTLLAGYPLPLDRYHTTVLDDLRVRCFYLANRGVELGMAMLDVGELSKKRARAAREAVERACGVPWTNIAVSCTHTHSAPVTGNLPFSMFKDERELYPFYLDFLQEQVAGAMSAAKRDAFPARVAFANGHCGAEQGVGGNRRNKDGPSDPDVPVMAIYEAGGTERLRGVWVNYALHPTFLHAENRGISADYPGAIYEYFKTKDQSVVVGFTMGAAGNQSSRHFRGGQTIGEAHRVGTAIAREAECALGGAERMDDIALFAVSVDFEPGTLPIIPIGEAIEAERNARAAFDAARDATYAKRRTLECALFGAEHNREIAEAGETARRIVDACAPFELMVLGMGDARFAFFPCEMFVEYGLRMKKESPMTVTITLANGAGCGYMCTPEAHAEGGYEASWTRYAPDAGDKMIDAAIELIHKGLNRQ